MPPLIIIGGVLFGVYILLRWMPANNSGTGGGIVSQADKAVDAVLYVGGLTVWTWAVGSMGFNSNHKWYVRAIIWITGAIIILVAINTFAVHHDNPVSETPSEKPPWWKFWSKGNVAPTEPNDTTWEGGGGNFNGHGATGTW